MNNQLKALEILKDSRNNINYSIQHTKLNKDEIGKYKDRLKYLNIAIEELENYESDMDKYLDYTTNSRCSKSFNSNLNQIKQAHDKAIEDIEYSQIRKAAGL